MTGRHINTAEIIGIELELKAKIKIKIKAATGVVFKSESGKEKNVFQKLEMPHTRPRAVPKINAITKPNKTRRKVAVRFSQKVFVEQSSIKQLETLSGDGSIRDVFKTIESASQTVRKQIIERM